MKQDNKGFSLVELIIVIALMSVMLTIVVYGNGMLSTKAVGQCSQQLYSSIQFCRTTTMGKSDGSVSLTLKRDTDNKIILEENIGGTVRELEIGKADLTISYTVNNGLVTELASDEEILLCFDRSTGGLKRTANSNTEYYTDIIIAKGTKAKTIKIIPFTGKVSLQ